MTISVFLIINVHFLWTMNLVENENKYNLSTLLIYNEEEFAKNFNLLENSLEKSYICQIKSSFFSQTIWPVIDQLLYSLLPFIMVLFLNILIIFNVAKSSRSSGYLQPMNKVLVTNSVIAARHRSPSVIIHADQTKNNKQSKNRKYIKNEIKRQNTDQMRASVDLEVDLIDSSNNPVSKIENMNINVNTMTTLTTKMTTKILVDTGMAKNYFVERSKKNNFFSRKFTFMLLGISFSFLINIF